MAPSLFPCFAKLELLTLNDPFSASSSSKRKRWSRQSLLKIQDGVLQLPNYRIVQREACPTLQYAWEQNWNEVLAQCLAHPEQALAVTQHSGRTALHLATFNHPCPLEVAQALLKANRHMVLVQDSNWYTPLHNICFFPGESLVKLFCDTAIMVEQELGAPSVDDNNSSNNNASTIIPPTSGTSPLFLASKRAAPLQTLRYLLGTRCRTEWISPSTGGEPYWSDSLDEYSSPLEILLRDRAMPMFFFETEDNNIDENNSIGNKPILRQAMKAVAYERLRQAKGDEKSQQDQKETAEQSFRLLLSDDQDLKALSLWQKCLELLAEHVPRIPPQKAAETEAEDDEKEYGIVHAIACAKVPVSLLLQLALFIFPQQAMQRDQRGMLPLHHVLMAQHPYATETLVSNLLHHDPQAARIPLPDGRSPLSLALELQLPSTILRELLQADSHASLVTMDPNSGLYPFCVAASREYDLTVIYTLLVAQPQVLKAVT